MAKSYIFGSRRLSLDGILALDLCPVLGWILGLGLIVAMPVVGQASGVTAQISQVGETLHLEFKGQSQWDYDLEKKEDSKGVFYTVQIPRLNEANVMDLQKVQSPGLQSLAVQHDGSDGRDVLILRLKDKNWEAFDYLTDQPSRLMIDFFQNKKPAKAPAVVSVENKKPVVKKATVVGQTKKLVQRQPSTADVLQIANQGPIQAETLPAPGQEGATSEKMSGIFDGGDPQFDRFHIKDYEIKEDSAIAQRAGYYIQFPMLKVDDGVLEKINGTQPLYEITAQDNDENKQARLLLTLFQNKRYNVFLQAVTWFNEKYPKSQYDEQVRFMWADTHYALWQKDHDLKDFDMAMLRYRQALEKYPQSPLMERTLMLMGFASLDRGDALGTLRLFQEHIRSRPQSPNRDLARLAVAKTYANLSQFDAAASAFEEIEKQASARKYQIMAAYTRGDVEYQRKDYKKAIELYQRALKEYPEGATDFPNAYYNQAAAYFELKKPRESLETYLDFLKHFPNHSSAGFAMTRVGELLQMLGADPAKVMGAYLETYFRYGDGPSSVVARLRLLTSRMSGMKEKEVEKAVADVMALAKKSSLDKIEEFATVLIADGYANRKNFDKSIDILTKYYQQNPTTANTKLIEDRIVRDINSQIREQVDAGNFLEALRTHAKYANTRLKNSDRIDTQYQLARAFEQAGVPHESEKLYRTTLNRLLAVQGKEEEKERRFFEKLPSVDTVTLRLAEAQAKLGQDTKAYDSMRAIKNPELLTDNEQIERVQLASQLLEKKGDLTSAARYLGELIKTWKGEPELVAPPYLQLAELEVKQKNPTEALRSLERINQLMVDSQGKVPANIHEKALERMSELQQQLGQNDQAMQTLQTLLDTYEQKWPLASYRYNLGQIHFAKGELAKANEVWSGLKGDKASIWYDLAQEKLKNSNWNSDYKKYIQRIPAMSKDDQ